MKFCIKETAYAKWIMFLLGMMFFIIAAWVFESHRPMLLHKSILPGIVMFVCVWVMD